MLFRSTLLGMADARSKFMQPDEDTPFGRHLKEVTKYLNIGIPASPELTTPHYLKRRAGRFKFKFQEGRLRQSLNL